MATPLANRSPGGSARALDSGMTERHLVLAGAGHAHLDLLAALRGSPLAGWRVTVITPEPVHGYSGMLPAVIAGDVPPEAAQLPVAMIAARAGASVVTAAVTGLDASTRRLSLSTGEHLGEIDLLSIDVGSRAAGSDVPGVQAHAFALRPFSRALSMIAALDARIASTAVGGALALAVVGAGAAGVEVALAMRARVRRAGRVANLMLIDAQLDGGLPMHGFAPRVRELASRALASRGVTLLSGRVAAITADQVTVITPDGRRHSIDATVTAWVTGPAPHQWLTASGLDCDASGFPLASGTLALDRAQTIFGGGDCITLRDAPRTPKAGVYAVRMAPVLAHNVLRVARDGAPDRQYVPQADYLALLSTGDGRALLRWRSLAFEARAALWLKTRIDHAYLRRYRALAD